MSWTRNKYCSNHPIYLAGVSLNDFGLWLTLTTWLVTIDIPQGKYPQDPWWCIPVTFFYFSSFVVGPQADETLKGFPRMYMKLDNKVHQEVQSIRAGHMRILYFLS